MTLTCDRPRVQSLPPDLHLALCHLDDDRDISLSDARASLSTEEHERAMRFRFEHDQLRYIRGRGFMRRALGRRLSLSATDVPLTGDFDKKPALLCQGPSFNLSHSGDVAILAIRDDGPVGVDLELANRAVDPISVARGCFQPHERAVLTALPEAEQRPRFLTFWTAKEALMKLTGAGLFLNPKSIGLLLRNGLPCGFQMPTEHRSVSLFRPDFGTDYVVAVAWNRT